MRKALVLGAVLLVAGLGYFSQQNPTDAGKKKGPAISHDVYFALKDNSPEARKKLIDACNKYLTKHPGEVFYGAGVLAGDLKREVNDVDFDVALHIVFEDRAAHDQYQDAKRHQQFIDENKDNWKKVRVFDSLVQ